MYRAVGDIPELLRTRQVELAYLGIVMPQDRRPGGIASLLYS
jgi:hypothetical protein